MKLRVTVIDQSPPDPNRYPAAEQLIQDDWSYTRLTPEADDFVVVATQHKGDHQSIKQALTTPVRHIALIASRKRARLVLKYLREDGVDDMDLLRIYAPAGFDLGARTPEGIALSVISEIIACAHSGSGAAKRQPPEDHKVVLLPALKSSSAPLAGWPDGAA